MFKILTADEAIGLINDGARIGINAFLALCNPETLQDAVTRRFRESGHPNNLSLYCSAGFGAWDETRYAEPYVAMGAVKEVIASHYTSMPIIREKIKSCEIEAYNFPLGVLSHLIRASARRQEGMLSEVGVNLFVDPRVGTPSLNAISQKKLVENVQIAGNDYLYYKAPKFDVAFIRGTTVDPNGNITFEKEYVTCDAFALAQATKNNGGIVIVEVEQVSHLFARPRSVIVPGMLVDVVVVADRSADKSAYNGALSGDIHVPSSHMDYYMRSLSSSKKKVGGDMSADIIGERASRELAPGMIANIGIGIPETVGTYASKSGVLKDIITTVESGGIGGLPAPGVAFGATIGADMVCDMATQFDFYDGGGLDICFMGAFEVDKRGNVNAHCLDGTFAGLGGFANITSKTKTVVFCTNFTTKGLVAKKIDGAVSIEHEGEIVKYKSEINAISFSALNALSQGQRVLYVTERCVFELTSDGLKIKEVYKGIDKQKDIERLLDFDI